MEIIIHRPASGHMAASVFCLMVIIPILSAFRQKLVERLSGRLLAGPGVRKFDVFCKVRSHQLETDFKSVKLNIYRLGNQMHVGLIQNITDLVAAEVLHGGDARDSGQETGPGVSFQRVTVLV
jgi:hypothetical protein